MDIAVQRCSDEVKQTHLFQIRTQIPRPSMHPYRHMSGQRDAAP